MSFISEYVNEFREYPLRTVKPYRPEDKYVIYEGKELDPRNKEVKEREPTEVEEVKEYVKEALKSLRGQSAYYTDYCAHWDPALKTRPFVPKKLNLESKMSEDMTSELKPSAPVSARLVLKDTELMKQARGVYEAGDEEPTLDQLSTHYRVMGYTRRQRLKTGMSEYQDRIGRVAYEMVRDGSQPAYQPASGRRPQWGSTPQGVRQPRLGAKIL